MQVSLEPKASVVMVLWAVAAVMVGTAPLGLLALTALALV